MDNQRTDTSDESACQITGVGKAVIPSVQTSIQSFLKKIEPKTSEDGQVTRHSTGKCFLDAAKQRRRNKEALRLKKYREKMKEKRGNVIRELAAAAVIEAASERDQHLNESQLQSLVDKTVEDSSSRRSEKKRSREVEVVIGEDGRKRSKLIVPELDKSVAGEFRPHGTGTKRSWTFHDKVFFWNTFKEYHKFKCDQECKDKIFSKTLPNNFFSAVFNRIVSLRTQDYGPSHPFPLTRQSFRSVMMSLARSKHHVYVGRPHALPARVEDRIAGLLREIIETNGALFTAEMLLPIAVAVIVDEKLESEIVSKVSSWKKVDD